MRFIGKDIVQKRVLSSILCFSIVSLIYLGTQTSFSRSTDTRKLASISEYHELLPSDDITTLVIEETTTTTEEVVEETTTTTLVRVYTTRPTVVTSRPTVTIVIPTPSGAVDGPPRNITSLVGCIAYYESTWGDIDSNVFQFVQGTWQVYGGTGSPGNAPYWRQEEIFWLAWNDAGHHHWAAQRGRCF